MASVVAAADQTGSTTVAGNRRGGPPAMVGETHTERHEQPCACVKIKHVFVSYGASTKGNHGNNHGTIIVTVLGLDEEIPVPRNTGIENGRSGIFVSASSRLGEVR